MALKNKIINKMSEILFKNEGITYQNINEE